MGQYYTVANMDKKEVLCVEGKFIGGKLLEIAETATECFVILNQIAGPWKGDTVFVVGDYADLSDTKVPYFRALRTWTDKLHLTDDLYGYARDNFTKVDGITEDQGYRFIYIMSGRNTLTSFIAQTAVMERTGGKGISLRFRC